MQVTESSAKDVAVPRSGSLSAAGALGVAAALGISELVAGLSDSVPSLVLGIATFVIDTVPRPIKEFAIATFGTSDKLALAIGIVVVALGVGLVVGKRSFRTRALVFSTFGLLAALAAARTPQSGLLPALLNGAASAGAGLYVTSWLRRPTAESDPSRRVFLGRAGAVAGLAILAAAGGRYLTEKTRLMLAKRDEVVLPTPVERAPELVAADSLDVPGISPIVTPNDSFYRIDTAPLAVPQVDLATWKMTLKGMVDREVSFTYQDILETPTIERYVTISCVSNDVGGRLIGTAKWQGIPLGEVLDRAGVASGAEQVVARSVDGFTVGFPVDAVYDGRVALLAVGMNGEALPFEHGFPARLVVAGLYGYVSATKWLSEIELTTWDGFDAYWIPRGWAKEAPVKTQSRIDTPRGGTIDPGTRAIAGVAWAPNVGISKVEVRIDGGAWQAAELSDPISKDTWRQWNFTWDATSGDHTIQVRATDAEGVAQTDQIAPPAPDGATGYHTVVVRVK